MRTMSIDYAHKLLAIRKAEGFTQQQFSDLTEISLSAIKKYETKQQPAGAAIAERAINCSVLEKYTLWLMTDKTAPEAGQISPVLAHCGQDETTSSHSGRKTG